MSKSVIIQRGGVDETWNGIDVIQTQSSGSGRVDWVPEDTTATADKYINKNGTYNPEDEGLYGYSKVRVNVPNGTIVGKKQDGNAYMVGKDKDGYIIEEKVPTSIRVTTLPNVLVYGVGAYIGFDGIVVTAYDAEGNSMGEVPFEELIFPVTVTPHEPTDSVAYLRTSDLNTNWTKPIKTYDRVTQTSHDEYGNPLWTIGNWAMNGAVGLCICVNKNRRYSCWVGTSGDVPVCEQEYNSQHTYLMPSSTATFYGKTAYSVSGLNGSGSGFNYTYYPPGCETEKPYPNNATIWTAVYGDLVGFEGGFEVPVQWIRPGDNEMLETSYNVEVVPGPSGMDD